MPAEPPSADALVFDSDGPHAITVIGCSTFSASSGAASDTQPVGSSWSRKLPNPFFIVGAVLAVLVVVAWLGLESIPASVGHDVEATFASLPDDDHALEQWLKSQEGVVPHTVHVEREESDATKTDRVFHHVQERMGTTGSRPAI